MSIMDRCVGPREQVLNIPVACWWYGSSKPSSLPSIDAWLKYTASMAVLGEKFKRVPWATQPSWVVESRALFLISSSICPMLLMTRERLLYTDHVRYVWSMVKHRSSVENVWRIDRVSLAECILIWIVATLRYDNHLSRVSLHVAN
jgi:hypothetical protein